METLNYREIKSSKMVSNIKEISDKEIQNIIYRLATVIAHNAGSESYPHISYFDSAVRVGYDDEDNETKLFFWWGKNNNHEEQYVLDIPEHILKTERFRESLRDMRNDNIPIPIEMLSKIPEEGMWVDIDAYPSYHLTIRVTSDGKFYNTND